MNLRRLMVVAVAAASVWPLASDNGETLTPKEGFGVGAPRFTTLSKTYSWLNDVQTVAKMVSGSSSGMACDLFVVR
jgi:hypothetical protein